MLECILCFCRFCSYAVWHLASNENKLIREKVQIIIIIIEQSIVMKCMQSHSHKALHSIVLSSFSSSSHTHTHTHTFDSTVNFNCSYFNWFHMLQEDVYTSADPSINRSEKKTVTRCLCVDRRLAVCCSICFVWIRRIARNEKDSESSYLLSFVVLLHWLRIYDVRCFANETGYVVASVGDT